jgi:hypothetical protein
MSLRKLIGQPIKQGKFCPLDISNQARLGAAQRGRSVADSQPLIIVRYNLATRFNVIDRCRSLANSILLRLPLTGTTLSKLEESPFTRPQHLSWDCVHEPRPSTRRALFMRWLSQSLSVPSPSTSAIISASQSLMTIWLLGRPPPAEANDPLAIVILIVILQSFGFVKLLQFRLVGA